MGSRAGSGNHDLVLMSAGGGAGLLGSVARRVLRSSPAPLLLFRPRMESDGSLSRPDATRFERLLVALDGSRRAEEIIPVAQSMADALGSEIHLFRAVPQGSKEGTDRLGAVST